MDDKSLSLLVLEDIDAPIIPIYLILLAGCCAWNMI